MGYNGALLLGKNQVQNNLLFFYGINKLEISSKTGINGERVSDLQEALKDVITIIHGYWNKTNQIYLRYLQPMSVVLQSAAHYITYFIALTLFFE